MKYAASIIGSLTFLSLLWSSHAGAATPRFVDASKTCMAFWETIALDPASDKDQFAGIITALKALESEAGLALPRPLQQNTQTKVQMIMRTVSPICQAFRLRAGESEGDAPVWIDPSTGRSSVYCPEGTRDNGDGFGAIAGHSCKILGSIEDTLVELDEVARSFQSLSNYVEGYVLGNVKLAIADLDAKVDAGQLSIEATAKLDDLKQKAVKFSNFWLMVNKAWQQLATDGARLRRVNNGEELTAQDVRQCPTDSCVFERTFCYVAAKRYAVAYYEGEEWKWWGNGSSSADSSTSSLPPEFTTVLFHSGSRLKKEVLNSKLGLVSSPRGMCKPEDLKSFNLKLSKIIVPTTEPQETTVEPDPSINTTSIDNNQPGAACPADVLTHRESRWFDLPADAEGRIPGAVLKLCDDGVSKAEKFRCNPGYAQRNDTCVRVAPDVLPPPPPPPALGDCDADGLLDGETQESDMPAEPNGVPGKWRKKCEGGTIKVVGVVCHAGWKQQGNACVVDDTPPIAATDECKAFGLGEGDTRFEDMEPVDGKVRGRFQITCVRGALERDFFCLKPWYRVGDSCGGGNGPEGTSDGTPDAGGSGGIPDADGSGGMPDADGSGGMPDAGGSGGMPDADGSGGMPDAGGSGGMPDDGGSGGMPDAGGSGGMPDDGGSGGMPDDGGAGGIPGGSIDPTGGVPGGTGITIGFGGKLIGCISQLVTDLLSLLLQGGHLPPMPGQLIFQAGCLMQGGSCIKTPSGGVITFGPLGTLIDSITQQGVMAGGHALGMSPNGKMLIDVVTWQAVLSGPLTVGGQPIVTAGGSSSLVSLVGSALNTGTPLGTPPASAAAPVNIDGTSERPKFTSVSWLKALNAPGTGTPRPDGVNIPNRPGNGGSALRDCTVNGIIYRNGREWAQSAQGGMVVRYRCEDGTVRELSRGCSDGFTNDGGQCRRGCQVEGRLYRHGQRWDQVSGSTVQYLTCDNGSVRVYESGCAEGYSQDEQGQCQRGCQVEGRFYRHGQRWDQVAGSTVRYLTCENGNVRVYQSSCVAGYSQDEQGQCRRGCQLEGRSYRHGQRWDQVSGPTISYLICEDGNVRTYDRACAAGYSQDAQGQCQRQCAAGYPSGSYGVFDISNGKGNYHCNGGNWEFYSVASCNAGYTQSGNACVALPRDCNWPQGGVLRNGEQRRVNIDGGYVDFSCSNGQLGSNGAACYQGYQNGQSSIRFPYYSCVQVRPMRNCSYPYYYMNEVIRNVPVNHGQVAIYYFPHGRINAYCDDGTPRPRGLPQCDPGYQFPGGIFGSLATVVLGSNNVQCIPVNDGPR